MYISMESVNKMKLTCIVCPLGCSLTIKENKDKSIDISGHGCKRGIQFAESEFYNPQRMLTTIVSLEGGKYPFLPVISDGLVPKDKLVACIGIMQKTTVKAPVKMGDLIKENILESNINILAAKTVKMEEK